MRLAADERWTGLLQGFLGDGYDVIEEGLNGRTTDVDYVDRPGCNGREYFVPCLQSHHPLDAVVVMLGTNDLKTCFDRTPETIADALRGYVDDVAANASDRQGRTPTVVLVSPIRIDDHAPLFQEMTAENFDSTGVTRSRELSPAIRVVAEERGTEYVDAAAVARAGDDGLHLTRDSHAPLARLLAFTITRALARRTTTGRVREWHDEDGWGVIDSPETPGGCWAHFAHVLVAGYKSLEPGQTVELVYEAPGQDGYSFRAVEVWPVGETPVRVSPEMRPPFSTLRINGGPVYPEHD